MHMEKPDVARFLAGFGRRLIVCGKFWLDLAGLGKFWLILLAFGRFGQFWPSVAGHG